MAQKIDIHKDYVMWQLMRNLYSTLHLVVSYMQDTTTYGKEYQDAFRYAELLDNSLATFEEKLQACVERKENK